MQPGELQWQKEILHQHKQERGNQLEHHYSAQSVRPGESQLNAVDGHKPVMDHTLGTMANHHRQVHMT